MRAPLDTVNWIQKIDMDAHDSPLPSWNDTATRDAIVRFVTSVTQINEPDYVPPQGRVAVFDNDSA